MLADAYKIASDIRQAMPDAYDKDISQFKSKLKSLHPIKKTLASISQKFENYMTNDLVKFITSRNYTSFKHMISVNDCISDIIKYVGIKIDNAGVHDEGSYAIERKTSTRSYAYAEDDIDKINMAAVKCVNIVDNYYKLK